MARHSQVEAVKHDDMQAEIIAIGTELLLGVTVDTNSAYLAQQLAMAGVALVAVPEPEHSGSEYRSVHILVSDGKRRIYMARGFDLRIAQGYDLVAAGALELLRRWIEDEATEGKSV